MKWIKVLLYVAPLAAFVYERCLKLGLKPVLPVLGLAVGVVLELQR